MSYHEQALMRSTCAPMIRAALASAAISTRGPVCDTLIEQAGALSRANTEEWPWRAMELLYALHELRRQSTAVSNIMAENGLI